MDVSRPVETDAVFPVDNGRSFSVPPKRVSVITATLNSRTYLEDTIQSVLAQNYPSLEYVIVDGGSADGTVDLIRAHENRLAAWVSEPDQGIADAFNKGLAKTSGDYVLFLNSDDRLARQDAIEIMMDAARHSGEPEIIYGDCTLIDRQSSRPIRRVSIPFVPVYFRLGRIIPHPALFMKRSYIEAYGNFDTSFQIAMDFELLLRGIFECRVVHVQKVVTVVRSGGLSTRHRRTVVEEIIRALRKNHVIRTRIGELTIRGYFGMRSILRPIRKWISRRMRQQSA